MSPAHDSNKGKPGKECTSAGDAPTYQELADVVAAIAVDYVSNIDTYRDKPWPQGRFNANVAITPALATAVALRERLIAQRIVKRLARKR